MTGDLRLSFDVMDIDVHGHQPPVSIWMEVPGIHSFATIYRFWKEASYPFLDIKIRKTLLLQERIIA